MASPFADFDQWADERGYAPEDSAQAFADYLADRTGTPIVGRECGGDGLVITLPDRRSTAPMARAPQPVTTERLSASHVAVKLTDQAHGPTTTTVYVGLDLNGTIVIQVARDEGDAPIRVDLA